MKTKNLTIGKRITVGFVLLLVLGAILASLATSRMLTASRGAEHLAEVLMPESQIASRLRNGLAGLQREARGYGYTGDPDSLAYARMFLADMVKTIETGKILTATRSELNTLRQDLGKATGSLELFRSHLDATETNLNDLAAIRGDLTQAAQGFENAIFAYMADQKGKLEREITEALPPEKIQARVNKTILANQIIDHIDAIRIASYRAQALRSPAELDSTLPRFDKIKVNETTLLAETTQGVNREQLAEVGRNADAYRAGIERLVKNVNEAQEILNARVAAAAELQTVIEKIQQQAEQGTLNYSQQSAASLGFASRVMIIGLISQILIGLVSGLLIIRSVTRALTKTAESLSQGALQVAAASGQVSSSSQSLAEGASEQAASLEEISSSVEELASMTKRNADSAQSGKVSSGQARAAAETGASEMEQMQTAMNAIQQSSNDISKIIKTIDEIAFQTNILALNAAVEAARAGEAGAGFAVVADEVRSLAQRSAVAAKETADKIDDATKRSAQGVEISSRVATGLQQILAKAREVDQLVGEIATASHEQSEGISQINMAISQMDKVTQSNAASAEETASAAEELNAQSEELRATSQELAALVGMKTGDAGVPSETKAEAVAHPAPTPKKAA